MESDFDRIARLYKIYRAVPDQSNFAIVTRSQYVVPVAFRAVETIMPRIISVIFSATPPIQAMFRKNGDPEKLKNMDAMFQYLFRQCRLYWTIQSWVKESLWFGQSYLKVGWMQRKRTKKMTDYFTDEDGSLQQRDYEGTEIIEDRVDVQNVNIFSLLFDPNAHFPDPFSTSPGVVHKTRKRRSQILAMRDSGIYLPFDDSDLSSSPSSDQTPSERLNNEINRGSVQEQDKNDPTHTVYEYWEDERLVVEVDHKILLRDEGNPFFLPGKPKKKPFVSCCDQLVPGELWQIGEVEPLEHNQIEISTLRRQRADNNSLIINRMWIYNKDADVDLESLEISRPGGTVGARPVDGSLDNAVKPLSQNDINGASFREFQDLDKDGKEISGLLDYATGAAPERKETATTVQLLQAAANMRNDIKIRNYNDSMIELGNMIHARVKQLQTKPMPIKIQMPGQLVPIFKDITRDDIPDIDEVELTAPGNPSFLMKDARKQEMMQYYQALMSNPNIPPQASVEMLKLSLSQSEIPGIEPVINAMVPPPMPPMIGMDGAMNPSGQSAPMDGKFPTQPAPRPPMPPGLNENPPTLPFPKPRN
jgi:hypothetical protein